MTAWLLTQAQGEKAVEDWAKESMKRMSDLNVGLWDIIVPVLARAQLRQTLSQLSEFTSMPPEIIERVRKEAGLE